MEQAFGGSDLSDARDWQLVCEALEVATVLFLRKFSPMFLTHTMFTCRRCADAQ